jgi:phosphoribosylamine--glycine ligase
MWNIMQNMMDNDDNDPAQWMLDVVKGDSKSFKAKEGTCIGVVMANSDFPFNKKEEEDYLDFPILTDDCSEADLDHLHPCEVKLTKAVKMMGEKLVEDCPEWGTAGSYIMVCTGTGDTISEAKENAYKLVKKVKLGNDPQYRTDIGEKLEKQLPKITKFGFCKGWKY